MNVFASDTFGVSPAYFCVLTHGTPDAPVVKIRGEVDLATVKKLMEAIGVAGSLLDGRAVLVVDLEDVEFIDLTGVLSLIEEARAMRELGGELRLVAPGDSPAARTFELLGSGQMLHDGMPTPVPIAEPCENVPGL